MKTDIEEKRVKRYLIGVKIITEVWKGIKLAGKTFIKMVSGGGMQ